MDISEVFPESTIKSVKGLIMRAIIVSTVFCLWSERNCRIFDEKDCGWKEVWAKIRFKVANILEAKGDSLTSGKDSDLKSRMLLYSRRLREFDLG